MPDEGGLASPITAAWNCRLTTTGRKSGLARRVTLWFVPERERIYLTGGAANPQWCRNLRVNPAVEIEVGGRVLVGRARVVDDPAEAAAIRDRFTERYVLARLSRLFGGYSSSIAVIVDLDLAGS